MSDAVLKLAAAITAHGEEVSELALRKPTVEDLMQIGLPYLIMVDGGESTIDLSQKKIAAWIVRLAGIPLSSVKAMSIGDFSAAQAVVLGFFGTNSAAQVLS